MFLGKSFLLCFLSFFFCTMGMAQETGSLKSIELRVFQKEKSLSKILIGDEISVRISSSDKIPTHFFQNLFEGKFIFQNAAYLSELRSEGEGADRLSNSFEGKLAFIKPLIPQVKMKIPLKNLGISFEFINMNIEVFDDPETSKGKMPEVLSQGFKEKKSYIWAYLLGCLFLIVISWLGFLFFKKKEEEKKREERLLFWKKRAKSLGEREEIERFFSERKKWESILSPGKKERLVFEDTLMKHQYKRDWTEIEKKEVQESLLRLVKSFQGRVQ